MTDKFSWLPPALTPEEERLVDLYVDTGRPLDDLPYTADFERMVAQARGETSREACHDVLKQLFRLRKQGRLPRVTHRHLQHTEPTGGS